MLVFALLLQIQIQAADSAYATPALREFIARAASENRVPPASLLGYRAKVESELALILRDSLGRELVGQIEQIAARAEWDRDGRYDLHVVGFRSQTVGAPYSALTWTRMWTVPTLYGNRLLIGFNEGLAWQRDSAEIRRRAQRAAAAARDTSREQYRVVHPLSADRDRYYRFTGGDTIATLYTGGRAIRLVRVEVVPVSGPRSNFTAFRGELDFDADRHQLVRMRGRLVEISTRQNPAFVRATGAVAVAFVEFENAEIAGKYWLPVFQWSEFQAQMGLLGETRPIYRVISRFRDHKVRDSVVTLAQFDSIVPTAALPPTRAKLSFASKDSVSRYGDWIENLGTVSSQVDGDNFADLAPDVWKSTGKPRIDHWPSKLEDVVRYNRVEGLFTGVSNIVRFRDLVPGLRASVNGGWAWTEQTVRGSASLSLARHSWIHSARGERTLTSTNDFMVALESGLSIGPLFTAVDNQDYVDRWSAGLATTRILGSVDRALLSGEMALVEDRPERRRVSEHFLYGKAFLANRNVMPGRYARATVALEYHPRVSGESISPGFGARILYQASQGDVDWQRVEMRLAARRYWHGLVLGSHLDGGAVFGSVLPPQTLYEIGGYPNLRSYRYKEFGGDRAAVGGGLIAYHFPVMRTPRRFLVFIIPGISPGIGAGIQGGWTQASSPAARRALLALGGDGVTPISRPTERIRATADFRFTLLSGALGVGVARAVDQPDSWKPYFGFGLAF